MLRYSLLALLLTLSMPVAAQTIYKQVDKDGKVTYTDKPPAKDQKAEKLELSPERNIVSPLGTDPVQAKRALEDRMKRRADVEETRAGDIAEAQAKLDQAREALAAGVEPREDDWKTVAGAGQAARVLNEGYFERIQKLEAAVKQAEAEVEKAGSRPAQKSTEGSTSPKTEK